MKRYFVRVLDTGEAALDILHVKRVIRMAVYNPRFRTMPEGSNSTEQVLTFTPEEQEVSKCRRRLRHCFPGRIMLLRLDREEKK